MDNSKTNILTNFQKNVLKIDASSLKIIFYVVLVVVVFILIWGYFYGVFKVPKPKPDIQSFPKSMYQNAGKYYDDESGKIFIGKQKFQQEILSRLNDKIKPKTGKNIVENIVNSNRFIILETISDSVVNSEINTRTEHLKEKWESEIKLLEMKVADASFFDRSTYTDQIDGFRKKIELVNQLLIFAKDLRVKPSINLPYNNKIKNFQFVAGKLDRIIFMGNNKYIFNFIDGRPVTKIETLEKAGLNKSDINESLLERDDDFLKSIKKDDYNQYKSEIMRIIDQINNRIDPQRESYRNRFYKKWFMILIMALFSYLMFIVLLWYYTLIRRKGLSKKTTHEVYIATNITSLVFRIIALIIVILGIIALVVNLVIAIIGERSKYELFTNLGFWYSLIAPIMTAIFAITLSWVFVLWSEFICFLSNCYHIVFVKAYNDKLG